MLTTTTLDDLPLDLRRTMDACVQGLDLIRVHFESQYHPEIVDPLAVDSLALSRLKAKIVPVMRALTSAPYTGLEIFRARWDGSLWRWPNGAGNYYRGDDALDYEYCLYLLFIASRLDPPGMVSVIEPMRDDIVFNHLMKQVIEDLIALARHEGQNDVAEIAARAEPYIQRLRVLDIFRKEDRRWVGYRLLLRVCAEQGHVAAALKLLPKCNASTARNEITEIKTALVAMVSRLRGIDAALDLCSHQRFGANYHHAALLPMREDGCYDELVALLASRADLAALAPADGLPFLVDSFCNREKLRPGAGTVFEFDTLFDRVSALDPKIKAGAASSRDSQWMSLGFASIDRAYVERCRKVIKNNSIKRELADRLTRLAVPTGQR